MKMEKFEIFEEGGAVDWTYQITIIRQTFVHSFIISR